MKWDIHGHMLFEPYERVLMRDYCTDRWFPTLFAHYDAEAKVRPYQNVAGEFYGECIPYDKDTAKLAGTDDPNPYRDDDEEDMR